MLIQRSLHILHDLTFFIDSKTVSNVNGTIPKSWLFPEVFVIIVS